MMRCAGCGEYIKPGADNLCLECYLNLIDSQATGGASQETSGSSSEEDFSISFEQQRLPPESDIGTDGLEWARLIFS